LLVYVQLEEVANIPLGTFDLCPASPFRLDVHDFIEERV
jgi:hypothetical protein